MKGTLYVCGTPIGNLADVTLRLVRTLRQVAAICAEDTRHTRQLLRRYGLQHKPLLSCHRHNERARIPDILALLAEGRDVALVSDAGTPGVADPGYRVVHEVHAAGYPVRAVPGPNAAVTALSVSGLPADRFLFAGFLPRRPSERRALFEEWAGEEETVVCYEVPHRMAETLADLHAALGGDRRVAIARELTKRFEEVVCAPLRDLQAAFDGRALRGEFVLVIEGVRETHARPVRSEGELDVVRWREQVAALQAAGCSRSQAIAGVAAAHGVPRRQVYRAVHQEAARLR